MLVGENKNSRSYQTSFENHSHPNPAISQNLTHPRAATMSGHDQIGVGDCNFPQQSYCGFGGAELGGPIALQLPPGGMRVGENMALSTIHTLLQQQPGYKAPPSCGRTCGQHGGQHAQHQQSGKVSLCSSCGGRHSHTDSIDAHQPFPSTVSSQRQRIDVSGASGPQALTPLNKPLNQPLNQSGSGAHSRPSPGVVSVVAYGQEWCGWSKKQRDAVAQARHPNISYVTKKPDGAPDVNAFPAIFAAQGPTYKLLKMGFADVTKPEVVNALLRDAKALFV